MVKNLIAPFTAAVTKATATTSTTSTTQNQLYANIAALQTERKLSSASTLSELSTYSDCSNYSSSNVSNNFSSLNYLKAKSCEDSLGSEISSSSSNSGSSGTNCCEISKEDNIAYILEDGLQKEDISEEQNDNENEKSLINSFDSSSNRTLKANLKKLIQTSESKNLFQTRRQTRQESEKSKNNSYLTNIEQNKQELNFPKTFSNFHVCYMDKPFISDLTDPNEQCQNPSRLEHLRKNSNPDFQCKIVINDECLTNDIKIHSNKSLEEHNQQEAPLMQDVDKQCLAIAQFGLSDSDINLSHEMNQNILYSPQSPQQNEHQLDSEPSELSSNYINQQNSSSNVIFSSNSSSQQKHQQEQLHHQAYQNHSNSTHKTALPSFSGANDKLNASTSTMNTEKARPSFLLSIDERSAESENSQLKLATTTKAPYSLLSNSIEEFPIMSANSNEFISSTRDSRCEANCLKHNIINKEQENFNNLVDSKNDTSIKDSKRENKQQQQEQRQQQQSTVDNASKKLTKLSNLINQSENSAISSAIRANASSQRFLSPNLLSPSATPTKLIGEQTKTANISDINRIQEVNQKQQSQHQPPCSLAKTYRSNSYSYYTTNLMVDELNTTDNKSSNCSAKVVSIAFKQDDEKDISGMNASSGIDSSDAAVVFKIVNTNNNNNNLSPQSRNLSPQTPTFSFDIETSEGLKAFVAVDADVAAALANIESNNEQLFKQSKHHSNSMCLSQSCLNCDIDSKQNQSTLKKSNNLSPNKYCSTSLSNFSVASLPEFSFIKNEMMNSSTNNSDRNGNANVPNRLSSIANTSTGDVLLKNFDSILSKNAKDNLNSKSSQELYSSAYSSNEYENSEQPMLASNRKQSNNNMIEGGDQKSSSASGSRFSDRLASKLRKVVHFRSESTSDTELNKSNSSKQLNKLDVVNRVENKIKSSNKKKLTNKQKQQHHKASALKPTSLSESLSNYTYSSSNKSELIDNPDSTNSFGLSANNAPKFYTKLLNNLSVPTLAISKSKSKEGDRSASINEGKLMDYYDYNSSSQSNSNYERSRSTFELANSKSNSENVAFSTINSSPAYSQHSNRNFLSVNKKANSYSANALDSLDKQDNASQIQSSNQFLQYRHSHAGNTTNPFSNNKNDKSSKKKNSASSKLGIKFNKNIPTISTNKSENDLNSQSQSDRYKQEREIENAERAASAKSLAFTL
jgi:hypothetical protein